MLSSDTTGPAAGCLAAIQPEIGCDTVLVLIVPMPLQPLQLKVVAWFFHVSLCFLSKDFYVASLYDIIGKYWQPTSELKDPYNLVPDMPEGSAEVASEGGDTLVECSDDESEGDETLAAHLGLSVDVIPYLEPEVGEVMPVAEDQMALPVEPPPDSQVPDDTIPVEPLPTETAQAGESGAPSDKGSGVCGFSPEPVAPSPPPAPVSAPKADPVVEIEDSPEPSKGKGPGFEEINDQIQHLKILVCIPGFWFCFNFCLKLFGECVSFGRFWA